MVLFETLLQNPFLRSLKHETHGNVIPLAFREFEIMQFFQVFTPLSKIQFKKVFHQTFTPQTSFGNFLLFLQFPMNVA